MNDLELDRLFFQMVIVFLTGCMSAVALWKSPRLANCVSHGLAAVGCAIMFYLAGTVLAGGEAVLISIGRWLHAGEVALRIDPLAAFFLLLLSVVGGAASIYAIGYTSDQYSPRYAILPVLFNLFLLSTVLVFASSHAGAFLIAWELMTLTSLLLIVYEHEHAANVRAGFVYVVMTYTGTAFLMAGFFIMAAAAGDLSFEKFVGLSLTQNQRDLVFLLAFIGFGTKAGIIPLHVWLPKAHPAAPSHVSAVLSGVMLKTAIYGMARFYLEFLGVGPTWWGVMVIGFGVVSALLGVLYALMETDIKRLLAYSSLENLGVVLLGVGAGMVFSSAGKPLLAGLAWAAALFHAFNHGIFKALLFLAAGAAVQATGTRDLEALGGLIRRMPYTAAAFFVGALAISSLPPLNGFISEWLTLQSLFFLPQALTGVSGKIAGALLFIALAMTAALVAACFVKAFGIAFLARPRSRKAETAKEAPFTMTLPMLGLAGACLYLGLQPQSMLQAIGRVLQPYIGIDTRGLFEVDRIGLMLQANNAEGVLSVSLLAGLLLIGCLAAAGLYYLRGRAVRVTAPVWACGRAATPRNQYSATGFAEPVRWAFRWVLRSQRQRIVDENENIYVGRKLAYHQSIHYIVDEAIYYPVQRWILRQARFMKRLQAGSVQLYVGYVLVVTIVVLAWSGRK